MTEKTEISAASLHEPGGTRAPGRRAGDQRSKEGASDRADAGGHLSRLILYRPLWLPVAITGAFLAVALGVLLAMSRSNVIRLHPVHQHMQQLNSLQHASLSLQEMLIVHLNDSGPIDTGRLEALRQEVVEIIAMESELVPESPALLRQAQATLGDLSSDQRGALIATLGQIRRVLALETQAHGSLVSQVNRATIAEFNTVVAAIIILPSLAALTLFLVRKRVLVPLSNLSRLLNLLGRGDYTPAPIEDVDPLLKPLMGSYNRLVDRLADLELQNASRQETLEQHVRMATETLLQQQRTLATAERLAAVGEVAAGIAHELRNPLAGMQVALGNLRDDLSIQDHIERLDLVVAELRRVTTLLNSLLDGARHTPEPLVDVVLDQTVTELLALARYQIARDIQVDHNVPAGLVWRLPRDRFKQALLNLVVNAADALDGRKGHILVSAQKVGDALLLAVSDDGPGFLPHVKEEAGRPFASGRSGGTGLGLAMVHRLARDLDGDLKLSNIEPHGARVELRLPGRVRNE